MPRCLEVINTYGTGNAALTTLAHVADPTQTLTIRASNGSPSAHIGEVWTYFSAVADATIHSPRMHDNIEAVQMRAQATDPTPLWDEGFWQPMYQVDTPTIQSVYGAAPGAGVAENLGYTVFYDDLPGIAARLRSWSQVSPLVKGYFGVKFVATSSATAGAIGANAAINATQDYFQINQDYALMGYNLSVACANVNIYGADTGNLNVGGPGTIKAEITRNWFLRLDSTDNGPAVPIINSANKSSTFVTVSHPTASTVVTGELIFAWLGNTGQI